MQQRTAALAAPTLLRHARRALLLLGAAFVWWLLFSGGPAQAADSVPQPGPDPVGVADQAAHSATEAARTAPHRVVHRAAHTDRTAPKPVREAVDATTASLEPRLTEATTEAADTVDRAVDRSTQTVRPTLQDVTDAVAPVLDAAGAPQSRPTSSTASTHRSAEATQPSSAPVVPAAVADSSYGATPDRIESVESPRGGLPTAPAAPATPIAPASSTSAGSVPAAALGGLLIFPPAVRRLRRSTGRRAPRLDPAYDPGCSPD
jgi:hypothetical protein